MGDVRHGTESRYVNRGCRCAPCREASAEARRRRRLDPHVSTHNLNGYRNGCRCIVCTAARRAYYREQGL